MAWKVWHRGNNSERKFVNGMTVSASGTTRESSRILTPVIAPGGPYAWSQSRVIELQHEELSIIRAVKTPAMMR